MNGNENLRQDQKGTGRAEVSPSNQPRPGNRFQALSTLERRDEAEEKSAKDQLTLSEGPAKLLLQIAPVAEVPVPTVTGSVQAAASAVRTGSLAITEPTPSKQLEGGHRPGPKGPPPDLMGDALQAWFKEQKEMNDAAAEILFELENKGAAKIVGAQEAASTAAGNLFNPEAMEGVEWIQDSSALDFLGTNGAGWKDSTKDVPAAFAAYAGLTNFHASARQSAGSFAIPTTPSKDASDQTWNMAQSKRQKKTKDPNRERSLSPSSGTGGTRGRSSATDSASSSRASSADSQRRDFHSNRGRGGGVRGQGRRQVAASSGGVSSLQ